LRLNVLKKFKKIRFMLSQGSRLHIKKRKEGIVKGLSWIEIVMTPAVLCLGKKRLSFVLIRIKSIVPVREDDDHFLNGMKRVGYVPFEAKVMGNNRPGNLLRGMIPFGKTSMLRKLLKPHLE
jgi:hypothetical protein